MKANLWIRKNIEPNTYEITGIDILDDHPTRATKKYEFEKWYPVGEFALSEHGNINVEVKADKVKLVSFACPVKYPEYAKGYKGPIVKHNLNVEDCEKGKAYYTCNV